jgi:hypothetical protein
MEHAAFGGILQPMQNKKPYPSFGYWYDSEFPTTNDVDRRCPGTAVLEEPPTLSPVIMTFPVPVGIFGDVHATQFWEVFMRNFNTPILQLRALQVGARAIWHRDDENTEASREIIEGNNSVEIDILQTFGNLTPEKREAMRSSLPMITQIVESSKILRAYWSYSNTLKAQVENITQRGGSTNYYRPYPPAWYKFR